MMKKFSLKNLTSEQKNLRKRILEISHKSHLSHLGSCLSAVDLIDAVYKIKKKDEKFILSNGHAGIAWYVVLEKNGYFKNSDTINTLHIHPDRNTQYDIHVSTGSLGQGLPIAMGMALADRKKNIYCMLSDGECTEGSIWEALRVGWEKQINNLKIILNANGWSAYNTVDLKYLIKRIRAFGYKTHKVYGHESNMIQQTLQIKPDGNPLLIFSYTTVEQFPFLVGQDAHYHILTDKDYKLAMELLA